MDAREFLRQVQAHPKLSYVDISADDQVLVAYRPFPNAPTGKHVITWGTDLASILENSWEDLLAVFVGDREPKIMKHITRIVGYYAYLDNWNRSKIAELADRRLGNYDVLEEVSL